MTSIGTWWRTVRYLRSQQIAGRAFFHLYRPTPDLRDAPPVRTLSGRWTPPARREPSLLGPSLFRLLNVEHDLDVVGWDNPEVAKLWRYNLHYFDDLNARDSETRADLHQTLLRRWIRENPPAQGTGWEPYPASLRIVNWIKWLMNGVPKHEQMLHSLAVQSRWVRRRLEYHLLGNHLFANAKALMFSGLFFDGGEADDWLNTGMRLLQRELAEQVLTDGGHFERSPMYHALALEDVLDLLNILAAHEPMPPMDELRKLLRSSAARMMHWLECMCHPDGTFAMFNDCAQGVAPSLTELQSYAERLGAAPRGQMKPSTVHLAASGYVRLERGQAVALLDVAPIGPDYLPGHAHADTLSFELSLGTRRLIVNGGTSCYGVGEQRRRERSTSSHSTVQLAGSDSSEVWAGFRVGRRARPVGLAIGAMSVCCSHDGYRFLPGKPLHRRCWRLDLEGLTVDDTVSSAALPGEARFVFAPGLRVEVRRDRGWRILEAASEKLVADIDVVHGRGRIVAATHAPEFGVLLPVECLLVDLDAGCASTRLTWRSSAHFVHQ